MRDLDLTPLTPAAADYLRGRRWFAGQGRPLARARLVWAAGLPPNVSDQDSSDQDVSDPAAPGRDASGPGGAGEPLLVHTVLEIAYTDGGRERYHVPLGLAAAFDSAVATGAAGLSPVDVVGEVTVAGRRMVAYDALSDARLRHRLLDQIAAGATGDGLRCRRYGDGVPSRPVRSRVLTAEQSNTSVVYDEALILKLFRRLEDGVNPELELTAALAGQGFGAIAVPLGSMETTDQATETTDQTTLAVVQPFYRDAVEGWQLALDRAAAWHGGSDQATFAAEARELGAVTAELHAALAAALPTARAGTRELEAERARREREVDQVIAVAPQLAELRGAMLGVFAAATADGGQAALQRVHGDYHLGQVLRTPRGWVILDFEGEPRRPLADRRRPTSPLRDVAGMLRSFDYAAFHQLVDPAAAAAPPPASDDPAAAGGPARERAVEWAIRARTAFLDGYAHDGPSPGAAAGAPARPRAPADRDQTDTRSLLRAFELEKALYEVMYEARYRPEWLPIPVGGVERLLR